MLACCMVAAIECSGGPMKLMWRAAVVVAGLLPALVASGCARSAPKGDAPGGGPTPTAAAVLTEAEARSLLAEVSRKNNRANAAFDSRLLGEYEAESSFRIDEAVYRIGRVLDPQHKDPLTSFEYTARAFHLPRSAGYPQWFLADTSISTAKRRYLLVLSRPAADQPWKMVIQAALDGELPAMARDAAGNAVTMPADDATALVAGPNEVAAAHAAYLSAGRSAPQAAMFASDKESTAIIEDGKLRASLVFVNKKTGVIGPAQRFSRTVTVEPYPVRVLRTTDGGALACYVTKRQVVAEQPDGLTKITGPDAALAGRTDFDGKITITWLDQWVVRIPPKGGGQVTVLAHLGGKESIT